MPVDPLSHALARLEQFLDVGRSVRERAAGLNDEAVPDRLVLGFLATLGSQDRVLALALCWRPAVLAAWTAEANEDDLAQIASNACTPTEVAHRLFAGADEQLRIHLARGHSSDPDLAAWLMVDESPRVRAALHDALAELRDWNAEWDDRTPDPDTVDWLHEAVPAAEIEDLLEDHVPGAAELAMLYADLARAGWDVEVPETEIADEAAPPDPDLEQAVALCAKVFGPVFVDPAPAQISRWK